MRRQQKTEPKIFYRRQYKQRDTDHTITKRGRKILKDSSQKCLNYSYPELHQNKQENPAKLTEPSDPKVKIVNL